MDKQKEASASDIIASVAAAYASRADATVDDIVALVSRLTAELGEHEDGAAAAGAPSQATATASQPAIPAPERAPLAFATEAPAEPSRAVPAIPIERAVTREKVYCLCCGKGFKMLKRHLSAEHGLTEEEYRLRFGLADDMPLVAPSYSERKANYAKSVGFGKYSRITA